MNTANTLPLPGPITAARRGRRSQAEAEQFPDAEIIGMIASQIRTRLVTADDVADGIEGMWGAEAAERAYELIYDCAGDAMNCLWEFCPMGWLSMLDFKHEQQLRPIH